MVRTMQKTLKALILIMLCFILLAPANAFATENPSVALEASITLEGKIPAEAEDYVLKMQDEIGTVQSITITGEGKGAFPTMEFTRVGTYKYTIWQEAGSNDKCEYDDSVYHITVTVTNEENGDGLETAVAAYKNDDTEKSAEIIFNNTYPGQDLPPAEPVEDEEKVNTGDRQNIVWYLTLLTVSVLLLVVLRAKHE